MITGVAVRHGDKVYSLPPPNRHHNILHSLKPKYAGEYEEGFIDDTGKFVSRLDAMKIAENNGQLTRRPGKEFYQGPELYSEDIW